MWFITITKTPNAVNSVIKASNVFFLVMRAVISISYGILPRIRLFELTRPHRRRRQRPEWECWNAGLWRRHDHDRSAWATRA